MPPGGCLHGASPLRVSDCFSSFGLGPQALSCFLLSQLVGIHLGLSWVLGPSWLWWGLLLTSALLCRHHVGQGGIAVCSGCGAGRGLCAAGPACHGPCVGRLPGGVCPEDPGHLAAETWRMGESPGWGQVRGPARSSPMELTTCPKPLPGGEEVTPLRGSPPICPDWQVSIGPPPCALHLSRPGQSQAVLGALGPASPLWTWWWLRLREGEGCGNAWD